MIDMATVGAITGFILALCGIFGYVLKVAGRINAKADQAKVSETVRDLHRKIDDMSNCYVRRDDLDRSLKHIQEGINRLDDKQDKVMESVLAAVTNRP